VETAKLRLKNIARLLGTSKNPLFFSVPLQFPSSPKANLPYRAAKHAFLSGKRPCKAGFLKTEVFRCSLLKESCGSPAILDIGCAYGAFLQAAKDLTWKPLGLEIAPSAVDYVNRTLHLDAIRAAFPHEIPDTIKNGSFDAVTMWYVIEHFTDVQKILETVGGILRPGGIFAFSTPNLAGISGRKSVKKYLDSSPADPWTIWSPRSAKKILRFYGLYVRKIVITGHHSERFPFFGKIALKKGLINRILQVFSRLLKLGDTFEVYAEKK
jgi:2-polyprenyl-3-methyl-5-hydroxy-6-metoxy-1,4-benzoquinol methylase